jgi:hypothetical protein
MVYFKYFDSKLSLSYLSKSKKWSIILYSILLCIQLLSIYHIIKIARKNYKNLHEKNKKFQLLLTLKNTKIALKLYSLITKTFLGEIM